MAALIVVMILAAGFGAMVALSRVCDRVRLLVVSRTRRRVVDEIMTLGNRWTRISIPEGRLARSLLAGWIDGTEYRRRMERIAGPVVGSSGDANCRADRTEGWW